MEWISFLQQVQLFAKDIKSVGFPIIPSTEFSFEDAMGIIRILRSKYYCGYKSECSKYVDDFIDACGSNMFEQYLKESIVWDEFGFSLLINLYKRAPTQDLKINEVFMMQQVAIGLSQKQTVITIVRIFQEFPNFFEKYFEEICCRLNNIFLLRYEEDNSVLYNITTYIINLVEKICGSNGLKKFEILFENIRYDHYEAYSLIKIKIFIKMNRKSELLEFINSNFEEVREQLFIILCDIRGRQYKIQPWEVEYLINYLNEIKDLSFLKRFHLVISHIFIQTNVEIVNDTADLATFIQIMNRLHGMCMDWIKSSIPEDNRKGIALYTCLYDCFVNCNYPAMYNLNKKFNFPSKTSPTYQIISKTNFVYENDIKCIQDIFSAETSSTIVAFYDTCEFKQTYGDAVEDMLKLAKCGQIQIDYEISALAHYILCKYSRYESNYENFFYDMIRKIKVFIRDDDFIETNGMTVFVCLKAVCNIGHFYIWNLDTEFVFDCKELFQHISDKIFTKLPFIDIGYVLKVAERILTCACEAYLMLAEVLIKSEIMFMEYIVYIENIMQCNLRYAVSKISRLYRCFINTFSGKFIDSFKSHLKQRLSTFSVDVDRKSRLRCSTEHRLVLLCLLTGVENDYKKEIVKISMDILTTILYSCSTEIVPIILNCLNELLTDASLREYTNNYLFQIILFCLLKINPENFTESAAIYRVFHTVSGRLVGNENYLLAMQLEDLFVAYPILSQLYFNIYCNAEELKGEVGSSSHINEPVLFSKLLFLSLITKCNNENMFAFAKLQYESILLALSYLDEPEVDFKFAEFAFNALVNTISFADLGRIYNYVHNIFCAKISKLDMNNFAKYICLLEKIQMEFKSIVRKYVLVEYKDVLSAMMAKSNSLRILEKYQNLKCVYGANSLSFNNQDLGFYVLFFEPVRSCEILKSTIKINEITDNCKILAMGNLLKRIDNGLFKITRFPEILMTVLLSSQNVNSYEYLITYVLSNLQNYNFNFNYDEIYIINNISVGELFERMGKSNRYGILYIIAVSKFLNCIELDKEKRKVLFCCCLSLQNYEIFTVFKLMKMVLSQAQCLIIFIHILISIEEDEYKSGAKEMCSYYSISSALTAQEVLRVVLEKEFILKHITCVKEISEFFMMLLKLFSNVQGQVKNYLVDDLYKAFLDLNIY